LWQENHDFPGAELPHLCLGFLGVSVSREKNAGNLRRFRFLWALVDQFMERMGIAQAPLVGTAWWDGEPFGGR